ncbi:MAG TPA: FHA domain-containing protein [Gemmataceae bacterium]
MLEVERQGQREKIRHTLSLPFALIGRDERADLRLDDERVSSRHAYLQVAAGRLWWVDLGSRTGTHGQPDQPPGLLRRGQDLRIGSFVIRLADGGPPENDAATLPNPLVGDLNDSSQLPRVGLDFLEGTASQALWMVDRGLTLVGRAALCKVRLHSPAVSRTHCALLRTPAGLWVVDLLGREGTHVNGMAVRWARLEDDDELRIGQFLIRVRFLGQPKRAPLHLPPPSPLSPRNGEDQREGDATEAGRTNALLPLGQALIPSTTGAEALPADLEGLLSALSIAAPPSAIAPTAGGTAEALLLPMIRQFSLMQQQMFDQFQQALLMMVQMFSGLHRDQLQLIRQELNQLSVLTRELQSLQAEQVRQTPAGTLVASGERPPPVGGNKELTSPARPGQPPPPLRPSAPAEKPPAATAEENSAPTTRDSGRPNADAHTWLAQRLATLQQERQSRWQRILQVLTGK